MLWKSNELVFIAHSEQHHHVVHGELCAGGLLSSGQRTSCNSQLVILDFEYLLLDGV